MGHWGQDKQKILVHISIVGFHIKFIDWMDGAQVWPENSTWKWQINLAKIVQSYL